VAQRQSLKAAAPELGISVSALSRRIQTLEAHLGLVLFERGAREFRLTTAGAALLENVCAAFDMLWESIAALSPSEQRPPLRIGAPAGIASYWLAPRIADFKADHPQFEVSIDTDNLAVGRLGSGLHAMVLVCGDGEAPSGDRYQVQRLAPLRVMAVCAPSLLESAGGEMEAIDLCAQTVLTVRAHADWFGCWLREVGSQVRPLRVEHYDSVPVLLEATASGLGVAILPELLAQPHLASGRLVDPFQARAQTRTSYYFAAREGEASGEAVQCFRTWIGRELARDLTEAGATQPVARPAAAAAYAQQRSS
jgi:LysR family glycine cleavage system transcriptional activator